MLKHPSSMTTSATLIFPHQLFREHPSLLAGLPVYLVEEWLFFRQYEFHRQKLVLHRASMKFYEHWLLDQGYEVHYISTRSAESECRELISTLSKEGIRSIRLADPTDDWLGRRLNSACKRHGMTIEMSPSPNFLTNWRNAFEFFDHQGKYFQTDFYIWQRKRWGLLLESDKQPKGGRWSFDDLNRKRFPKGKEPAQLDFHSVSPFLEEAQKYIAELFPRAYGSADSTMLFALTYEEGASIFRYTIHPLNLWCACLVCWTS